MDQVLLKLGTLAGDDLPVRQLHLRGIIDMLAAFLGEEKLCMAVYDYPKRLAQLADTYADLYVAVAKKGLSLRSRWRGGYVSSWKLYAPGLLVDYQIDTSCLFSAEVYKQHFLQHDRKVIKEFPYSVVHTHACGLHILDALLEIEELKAVQISSDSEAGAWDRDRVLRYCKTVQEHSKSVILYGQLTEHELLRFQTGLHPNGFAICYSNP